MRDHNRMRLDRRQFLKVVGVAGASIVPAYLGYRASQIGKGISPEISSPYVDISANIQAGNFSDEVFPILVVNNTSQQNSLNNYLAEILLAEGLNCFQITSISEVDNIDLHRYLLVLLSEGTLNTNQAEQLSEYVAKGGHLIAMRPGDQLASIFSVQRLPGETTEGYIQINTDHPFVKGMESISLQYHGAADHYALGESQALAWISDKNGNRSSFPALVLNELGQGSAAFWAYDLSKSIVYTRQGNPEWSNMERDGREGIRAHDAFVDWIDLDRIELPQADIQMRLLTRLITEMISDDLPLPRIWYFPNSSQSMLIATGDSHSNSVDAIHNVLQRLEARGGKMTIYYTPPLMNHFKRLVQHTRWWLDDSISGNVSALKGRNLPDPRDVQDWRSRGHEFSIHPYVDDGLEIGWEKHWKNFTGMGYGTNLTTVRTHKILWTGWVESARIQASYGIKMNLDYYHYGPAFRKNDGEWVYGYFTGSGLPMRFVDLNGRILTIYQQLTNLVDEHLFKMPWGLGGSNLDLQSALAVSRELLQKSNDVYHEVITGQFHVDPYALGGEISDTLGKWLNGTLDYAAENDIPIWTAASWLDFTERRRDTVVSNLEWFQPSQTLRFRIFSKIPDDLHLSVLIPADRQLGKLDSVILDGSKVPFVNRSIGGLDYGWIKVNSGDHILEAIYR